MVSLNLGYGVSWPLDSSTKQRRTRIIPNSYEDICATLDACYSRGTFPEPAVHNGGMLNNAITLMREGTIRHSHYFLVEPGGEWGGGWQTLPGTPRIYFFLTDIIREFYPNATWIAHSGGLQTFTIGALAIGTGAHLRVGLEDSPRLPNNPEPNSSAEHVEWAATLARLHGREPATPAQAREILGLLPPVSP